MKRSALLCLSALTALIYSCNNSGTNPQRDSLTSPTDSVQSRECYISVDGKDTAHLNIGNMAGGKVVGDLVIRYDDQPENNGTLKGEFRGDTLFADYTFTTGENKQVNRNPLAFLKEGTRLTLGVGEIETYLGRSFFAKNKPIDFDRGRFKFNTTECK